jgi:hypothetical protein
MDLIFVYYAESGLHIKAINFAHKIVSLQTFNCSLYSITHANFSVHDKWADFIISLKIPIKFLYKNEFEDDYPNISATYPVAYLSNRKNMVKLLNASEIGGVNKSVNLSEPSEIRP